MSAAPGTRPWLEALLHEELAHYDLEAARARLPAEVREAAPEGDLAPGARLLVARSLRARHLDAPTGREQAFRETVRGHVALLNDLALLAGEPFFPARRRAAVASSLAAALGEPALALDADPWHPDPATPQSLDRAFTFAARQLKARHDPPGDPVHGLPLFPGALAVFRRHLARVAMGAHRRGGLDPESLARHQDYARRESVLLVEALAGLLAAAGPPPPPEARAVRHRQLHRLGLPRPEVRAAARALEAPRPPEALAAAAPERVRPFLLEQACLARLRAGLPAEPADAWTEAFADAAGLGAPARAAARVEAAAQHGDHEAWFAAVGDGEWAAAARAFEDTADLLVERVGDVVTSNLGALATEIRETGELGALLAKATAGRSLTAEEKRKVKEQLIDLAKAVPALAIFAAPGGMLLLPLLAKLLPFSVLPSAWDRPPKTGPGPAPPPRRG